MKKLEETLKNFKSRCLDGRDAMRLAEFTPENRLEELGLKLKEPDPDDDYVCEPKEF